MNEQDTQERPSRKVFDLAGVPEDLVDTFRLDRLPLQRPVTSTADLLSLREKVAVVTGGGGNGLGNAICHRLAEQGARVAVVDVKPDVALEAAHELTAIWGVEAIPVAANVADWESSHAAIDAVVSHWGTVDILVNNAGGSGSIGRDGQPIAANNADFVNMSREDMDRVIGVNFYGVLLMTQAVLKVMLAKASGRRIIVVSSEGGKTGMKGLAVYNSSKSAVIGFTRNLAHEIGSKGVTIAAVCPGIMTNERLIRGGHFKLEGTLGETFLRTSIGRTSIPDEVASMVAFLASEAGSFVHGTAVSVSGGHAD